MRAGQTEPNSGPPETRGGRGGRTGVLGGHPRGGLGRSGATRLPDTGLRGRMHMDRCQARGWDPGPVPRPLG